MVGMEKTGMQKQIPESGTHSFLFDFSKKSLCSLRKEKKKTTLNIYFPELILKTSFRDPKSNNAFKFFKHIPSQKIKQLSEFLINKVQSVK